MSHFLHRFLPRLALNLAAIPVVMALANLGGFVYAHYVGPLQQVQDPYSFSGIETPPVMSAYIHYLETGWAGDWGRLPNNQPVVEAIQYAAQASLGLLVISLVLSALLGVGLGIWGVRNDPPRVSGWLTAIATGGLASPSFFVGIIFISLSVIYLIYGPANKPLLPFQGYGWDAHLILPVLALIARPTVQIAQVTSGLLAGELGKQYVLAARSFGHDLKRILRRDAFRNVIAPVILVMTGSMRLLIAELIIIERLFNWLGLG